MAFIPNRSETFAMGYDSISVVLTADVNTCVFGGYMCDEFSCPAVSFRDLQTPFPASHRCLYSLTHLHSLRSAFIPFGLISALRAPDHISRNPVRFGGGSRSKFYKGISSLFACFKVLAHDAPPKCRTPISFLRPHRKLGHGRLAA